jgi:hypothetical protein
LAAGATPLVVYVQWVAGSATAAAELVAEAEADAVADGEADVVALGFFAAAGVLPPANTLPLEPFAGAPSLPLSAPRQGCRLLYIAISPQRPVGGR